MVFLTRRATFSASHYYWNDAWSAEKNEQIFGRWANRNGHGHNYTLEVTVAGEPDPVTGFVVDLKWLKDVIEAKVLAEDFRDRLQHVATTLGTRTENTVQVPRAVEHQPSPTSRSG